MRTLVSIGSLLLLGFASGGTLHAGIINSSAVGWYGNDGFHDSTNANYIAGNQFFPAGSFGGGLPVADINTGRHDFFVFDLSGVSPAIVAATLKVFNPASGYSSPNSTESFSLFDVTTPIGDLIASQTTRTDIYNDLFSGTTYGSKSVSSADNNTFVTVNLDASAVAALNSGVGSKFAIGGGLDGSLDGATRFIFGGSSADFVPSNVQLDLQTAAPVPEPAGLTLWLTGLGILLAVRRRRSVKAQLEVA